MVAYPVVVFIHGQSVGRPSFGDSPQTRSVDSGHDLAPSTRLMEAMGVATERDMLMCPGISAETSDTIINSKAPSTRRLYAFKWRLFALWCRQHVESLFRKSDPRYS